VGPRDGLGDVKRTKIFPHTRTRTPNLGRPPRSQPLYRLRYPGPLIVVSLFILVVEMFNASYLMCLY
jgi:hypothetical protein